MADKVIVSREKLVAVADAVRGKTGNVEALTLDEMPGVISAIQTGGDPQTAVNDWLMGRVEEVDCDELIAIGNYQFDQKTELKRVRLANATSCGTYNFRQCRKLVELDLPKVASTTGTNFCVSCEALERVNIPLVTGLDSYSFRYAYALKFIDLPSVGSIASYCFATARSLETLVLRKSDAIATLNSSGTFVGSGVANGTGYIYVPKALLEEYKGATNWSKFADQIRAIEDYPEITGG